MSINTAHNFKDLTGQKFGRLIVIEKLSNNKHRKAQWLCCCEHDGNKIIVPSSTLISGHTKSCGCLQKERVRDSQYIGTKNISGTRWCQIKHGAYKRNIDFNLVIEWAQQQLEKQNFKCYFTGLNIISPNNIQDGINCNWTASLDRLNPKLGYTEENCVWVHKDINIIKYIYSEIEFLELCLLIYLYQEKLYIPLKRNIIKFENSHHLFKGYNNISSRYLSSLKRGATKRNISWNLTIKEMWEKYIEQNGICAISGIFIDFAPSTKLSYLKTASLDRINSNIGYQLDNIQWVNKDLNKMRMDYTIQEFLYYIYLVVKYKNLI